MIKNKLDFETIESLAKDLLLKHKITAPCTPVQELAESEGLTLLSYDFGEDVSGVLLIKNKRATIGYSTRDSKLRRRFTIAHELGHYFLHWLNTHDPKSDDIFVDKDFIVKFRNNQMSYNDDEFRQEQEANAFAAALLMPAHLITDEFTKGDYWHIAETDVIAKLAKTFDVSIPAMTYRLSNLNFLHTY